ncbi:MAG: cysteine--tRNA ligase, partial [Pseudomonadota bacterium]
MTAGFDIRLHDTLAGEKRLFEPADPERVSMYVCGPTVYARAHIGNARPAVVFDLLSRLLRRRYGADKVVYVRNFTDVDDKIIVASQETGEPINAITKRYEEFYVRDMGALGVLRPEIEPRATGHIDDMVRMVATLIENGVAYHHVESGHVLFEVAAYVGYGQLSRAKQDEMIAGARVEVAPYKKDPADFVLWKPSAPDEPGWESPWGRGRPGWHLECSAMIGALIGPTVDIHGGGHDLRFPHHENEIAQSACAHGGAPLARYWMHNGFLRMGADKMSKSLGNIVLTHDLLKDWRGEVIRWALLSAHYRQPLEWTDELLEATGRSYERIVRPLIESADTFHDVRPVFDDALVAALSDDLNTPKAFAELFRLADRLRDDPREETYAALLGSAQLLGVVGDALPETASPRPAVAGAEAAEIEAAASRQVRAARWNKGRRAWAGDKRA